MIVKVFSLDVIGHSSSDCCQAYGCKCVPEDGNHDDDKCQCDYDINQKFTAGSIEMADDTFTDSELLEALVENEYLIRWKVSQQNVEVIYLGERARQIRTIDKSKPLLELEWN